MSNSQSGNSGKAGSWAALPKGFRIETEPGYRGNTPVTKRTIRMVQGVWVTRAQVEAAQTYAVNANLAIDRKVEPLRAKIDELQRRIDELEAGKLSEVFQSMSYPVDDNYEHDQDYAAVRFCSAADPYRHGVEYLTEDGRFVEKTDRETGRPVFEAKATH